MGMMVRRAESNDIEWMLMQLRVFAKFFGSKKNLFPESEFARARIGVMIHDHVVFVAEKDEGHPVGFIAGYFLNHPFNPEIKTLSEQFWWVDEHYRGSRAAFLLFKAFVDFGKKHADWICMGLEVHSPVSHDALTKRGFRLQERSFLMEVT